MNEHVELYQSHFLTAGVDFTAYLRVLRHLPALEDPRLVITVSERNRSKD